MKFSEFYSELCEFAPIELSRKLCEKDDVYDNSGIIVEPIKEDINGILFSLDLTEKSVKRGIEEGCDLIVTHHPAIYSPIKNLTVNSPVYTAIRSGIGVVSFHLNIDCAKEGTDYWFAEGLGGKNSKIYEDFGAGRGYGRASVVEKTTGRELLERYKRVFNTQNAWFYGDENKEITKIATFCGAGLDEGGIEFAIGEGAQAVASADIKHHVLLEALQSGLSVLSCAHYATENYGMKKIYGIFSRKFKDEKIIFFDDGRLS